MTIKEIAWQIIEREKFPYFTSDDYEDSLDEHLVELFGINFDEFKEKVNATLQQNDKITRRFAYQWRNKLKNDALRSSISD